MERSTYGYNRCLKQESSQSITWIGQPETRFTFDHVACETVDQVFPDKSKYGNTNSIIHIVFHVDGLFYFGRDFISISNFAGNAL